jgi:DNA-binding transcriptional LysR family regulator
MMDLRQLRSFVAVAEELSFRRAAERLRLSQPPLSRQIQALESELGVRLLNRDRNSRISLTDAGHTFLADAKQTLAQAQTAIHHARESTNRLSGQLKIANIPRLSTAVLPPLLQAFHKKFPRIEVSLVEMTRPEQLAALREKRIHLAFFPDLGAPFDNRFKSLPIFSCRMVAVLPSRHQLATESGELHIAALAADTLLIPSLAEAPGYIERLNQLSTATGFTPAATQEVIGVENRLGMVGAGYGVAILPEVVVSATDPAYKVRRLRAPVPPFRLRLLWLKQPPSVALQNFVAVAKQWATERKKAAKTSARANTKRKRGPAHASG